MKSTKHQHPSSREISSTKLAKPVRTGVRVGAWSLELLWMLELSHMMRHFREISVAVALGALLLFLLLLILLLPMLWRGVAALFAVLRKSIV